VIVSSIVPKVPIGRLATRHYHCQRNISCNRGPAGDLCQQCLRACSEGRVSDTPRLGDDTPLFAGERCGHAPAKGKDTLRDEAAADAVRRQDQAAMTRVGQPTGARSRRWSGRIAAAGEHFSIAGWREGGRLPAVPLPDLGEEGARHAALDRPQRYRSTAQAKVQ